MKTKHGLLFGFAVLALAAIFSVAGCDNGNTPGGVTTGELTIANIPEDARGDGYLYIIGYNAADNTKGILIADASQTAAVPNAASGVVQIWTIVNSNPVDFEDGTYTVMIKAGSSSDAQTLVAEGETVFAGNVAFSGGKGTATIEE